MHITVTAVTQFAASPREGALSLRTCNLGFYEAGSHACEVTSNGTFHLLATGRAGTFRDSISLRKGPNSTEAGRDLGCFRWALGAACCHETSRDKPACLWKGHGNLKLRLCGTFPCRPRPLLPEEGGSLMGWVLSVSFAILLLEGVSPLGVVFAFEVLTFCFPFFLPL